MILHWKAFTSINIFPKYFSTKTKIKNYKKLKTDKIALKGMVKILSVVSNHIGSFEILLVKQFFIYKTINKRAAVWENQQSA